MNRTIKDATVKRYCYANHDELRRHLQLFIDACNHARLARDKQGGTAASIRMGQALTLAS